MSSRTGLSTPASRASARVDDLKVRRFSERILRLHAKRLAIDREAAAVYAEAKKEGVHLAVRTEVARRRQGGA